VGLALRLQNMLERHATFEGGAGPHHLIEDPARVDRAITDHRRQRRAERAGQLASRTSGCGSGRRSDS
jgi:hypothetical protein